MTDQYFHMTIGPVQDFVSQARRTRDFWAGSFILSFLSSVAMAAVRQQQGMIEFPVPDENYLAWLENKQTNDQINSSAPQQGSVPNRFKSLGAKVGPEFDPNAVISAVRQAWQVLAELVWQGDLASGQLASIITDQQRSIWDRQINRFWDISWAVTEDNSASDIMDRRKSWRTHRVADEPGVKCDLMEGYQELSAEERPGAGVRKFWQALRSSERRLSHDLHDTEALCAIAFVKRRFVYYFSQLEVTLPKVGPHPEKVLYGWPLPENVPSVAYLAAMPWLAHSIGCAAKNSDQQACIERMRNAIKRLEAPNESFKANMITEAINAGGFTDFRWGQVNGQYLFRPAVDQMLKSASEPGSQTAQDADALRQIKSCLGELKMKYALGTPSPFYAVLLMDGDSLGSQMSMVEKQPGISHALNAFNQAVPAIISAKSGFLVYAGGDDVLALLPMTTAIECADAVRKAYDECFASVNRRQPDHPIETSLSGAIQFAYYKTPLTKVLSDSHDLLDNVAKEEAGRNSLAIRVRNSGGLLAQWSAPWDRVTELQHTVRQIRASLGQDMASGFLFKLENIIDQLSLDQAGEDHGFQPNDIAPLVTSAWQKSRIKGEAVQPGFELPLLHSCQISKRVLTPSGYQTVITQQYSKGAIKLLEFLSRENRFSEPKQLSEIKEGSA